MKSLLLFSCVFIVHIASLAQGNLLPERQAMDLKLAVNDSTFYEMQVKASPYVLPENTVQIYPGERVFVEFETKGRRVKSIQTVKEVLRPEKTVIISFGQVTEGRTHKGMMLEVTNPFGRKLEYEAIIFLMHEQKWIPTTVVPVPAGLGAYETWPDAILTVAISKWKLK